jgi:hypothetical protein
MKAGSAKPVRCAIYTRVSTDQGLEQDFNSLGAQRDASQAYIRSQAHAGWTLLRGKYDDGGLDLTEGVVPSKFMPAPGTGLRSPETVSQNLGCPRLQRQRRPQNHHLNPLKCPQIAGYVADTRNSRLASNCVVVDAAPIEPVSTANSLLTGKLTGNFAKSLPFAVILRPIRQAKTRVCSKFPG